MTRVSQRKTAAALIVLFALLPTRILAHAGVGIQHLDNVPAGPFRVYAWTDPEPPQVGEYHVTVALTENVEGDETGLGGGPVLDAYVLVELVHQESGEKHSAVATHDDALNKLFYEASFAPEMEGTWSVQLRIAAPGCRPGEANDESMGGEQSVPCAEEQLLVFEDEILPKESPWRAAAGGLFAVILILAAVLLYWKTQPPAELRDRVVEEDDSALARGSS